MSHKLLKAFSSLSVKIVKIRKTNVVL